MKKILFVLFLFIVIVMPVSAGRIAPTDDIGLFIEESEFWYVLGNIFKHEYITTDYSDVNYVDGLLVKDYLFSNGIMMRYATYKYDNKIFMISVSAIEGYDNELFTTFLDVFAATGLCYDYNDEGNELSDYVTKILQIASTKTYYGEDYKIGFSTLTQDGERVPTYVIYPQERSFSKKNGCDENYVGACVPITNKDLDCKAIGVRNFFVIGNDNHYFDGDNNGVCCEPYPQLPF